MKRYLVYFNNKGRIVDLHPRETSAEDFGQLQAEVAQAAGGMGKYDFASMVELDERQKTPSGVYYDWELAGPGGASYALLALPGTTGEQIELAKAYILDSFDAVRLQVWRVDDFV